MLAVVYFSIVVADIVLGSFPNFAVSLSCNLLNLGVFGVGWLWKGTRDSMITNRPRGTSYSNIKYILKPLVNLDNFKVVRLKNSINITFKYKLYFSILPLSLGFLLKRYYFNLVYSFKNVYKEPLLLLFSLFY